MPLSALGPTSDTAWGAGPIPLPLPPSTSLSLFCPSPSPSPSRLTSRVGAQTTLLVTLGFKCVPRLDTAQWSLCHILLGKASREGIPDLGREVSLLLCGKSGKEVVVILNHHTRKTGQTQGEQGELPARGGVRAALQGLGSETGGARASTRQQLAPVALHRLCPGRDGKERGGHGTHSKAADPAAPRVRQGQGLSLRWGCTCRLLPLWLAAGGPGSHGAVMHSWAKPRVHIKPNSTLITQM